MGLIIKAIIQRINLFIWRFKAMINNNAVETLASYVDALRPIIYIKHFDFHAVDCLIKQIINNHEKIYEYNAGSGYVDFEWKNPKFSYDLETFLFNFYTEEAGSERFLILKDIHFYLENPKIISLLKSIAFKTIHHDNYYTTIFIVSSKLTIPTELENLITVFDIPLPQLPEIQSIIQQFAKDLKIEIEHQIIQELALSFKGLSEFEVIQILNLAYQKGGSIDTNDRQLIIREKEQIIKKTGILEIQNFSETIEDIGGLENLKTWLRNKATIFKELDKALDYGVDIPKGIMLVGMPGCGKSLVAKATSRLFEMPLLRLDIGKLLGKYVGESEENFRQAIKIAEAVSPCILWIDEIEKAFAGIGETGGGGDVTTRLFGNFLTWLQEKENTVFVIATANNISKFPPEFLRKGRFDELFSINFPNDEERKNIFKIHLIKRRKWHKDIDLNLLAQQTDQFSGADIEAVVKETIENAFIATFKDSTPQNSDITTITTDHLLKVIPTIQPLSQSFADKIKIIQESLAKMSFKPAS